MPSIENKMIKKLLHNIDRNISILEIGSGYCQKTEFLQNIGFNNITGVEKNEALVEQAKKSNFNVLTIEEFENSVADKKFDLLFLSHIIEHFQYQDLKGRRGHPIREIRFLQT